MWCSNEESVKQISKEDFDDGAGSKGQMDAYEHAFLYNFVRKIRPERVIEFSPCNGESTCTIMHAIRIANVKLQFFATHELRPAAAGNCRNNLKDNGFSEVEVKEGNVFHTMSMDQLEAADFVLIDSDHSEAFCERYYREFLPRIKDGCWVAVHDLRFDDKINPEAIVIQRFIEENNITNYFWTGDVLNALGIQNETHVRNRMLYFQR